MGGTLFSGAEGAQGFVDQGIIVPVWIVPGMGRSRAVRILAQLDTGSTESSIDVSVANLLRMHPTGSTPVQGFGGTVGAPTYTADLQTDGGVTLTQGELLGATLAVPGLRTMADLQAAQQAGTVLALLGREAMIHMDFSLVGPAGSWSAYQV